LGKLVVVIAVQLFLRIASALQQHTAVAADQVRVTGQGMHIKTALALAADVQPFVFPVLQLIWSQRERVAVADGQVLVLLAVELLACLVPER
jgi:hypothetical protein